MLLLRLLPLLALLPVGWSLAVTAPSTVVSGSALEFSWSGGQGPYQLKILVDDEVVSDNKNWASSSNKWIATSESAPIGSVVKLRVYDAEGNMVLS